MCTCNLPFTAENIKTFMVYYRSQFPTTPNSTCFRSMWSHGSRDGVWDLVCLGEQGAESIHAYFNLLRHQFNSIPECLSRLKQMMVAQHLKVALANTTARPPIKRSSLPLPRNKHCSLCPSPSTFPFIWLTLQGYMYVQKYINFKPNFQEKI